MDVIGAVLAGGAGTRIGGDKAMRLLDGRPLVSYPVATLAQVVSRVVIVAKRSTRLPAFRGVERWDEPDEPRHPLIGLIHALERAKGALLVCAADMPYVTVAACQELLELDAPAVVAHAGGRLEPLLGVYAPAVLPQLRAAPPDAPLTATVASLDPVTVALPSALVRSVNTPADLAAAESGARP